MITLRSAPRRGGIEKATLVTDVGWLRTAAGIEDKVLPGVQLRVFTMAEQAEARSWIPA